MRHLSPLLAERREPLSPLITVPLWLAAAFAFVAGAELGVMKLCDLIGGP